MTAVVVDASALIAVLTETTTAPPSASGALLIASEQQHSIICPPLAHSEALSVIRRGAWSDLYDDETAHAYLRQLQDLPITVVDDGRTHRRALEIATAMGWARTYDAEYCALAESHAGVLLTCDERLQRGTAGRLDYVVGPAELVERLERPRPD